MLHTNPQLAQTLHIQAGRTQVVWPGPDLYRQVIPGGSDLTMLGQAGARLWGVGGGLRTAHLTEFPVICQEWIGVTLVVLASLGLARPLCPPSDAPGAHRLAAPKTLFLAIYARGTLP